MSRPIIDEELVLKNSIAGDMIVHEARGDIEASYVREAGAKLIVEAYNQGMIQSCPHTMRRKPCIVAKPPERAPATTSAI